MQWLLPAIYFPKNQIQENYNFKSLINMLKVTQTTSGRDDIQTKTIGTKFNWLGKPGWGNDEHRDTSILCMVVCGRHCFFFRVYWKVSIWVWSLTEIIVIYNNNHNNNNKERCFKVYFWRWKLLKVNCGGHRRSMR